MVLVPLYDTLGPEACTHIINQGKTYNIQKRLRKEDVVGWDYWEDPEKIRHTVYTVSPIIIHESKSPWISLKASLLINVLIYIYVNELIRNE